MYYAPEISLFPPEWFEDDDQPEEVAEEETGAECDASWCASCKHTSTCNEFSFHHDWRTAA